MDRTRQIADTVLYEGYLLWPYRRSAAKNQKRWTFGGVYPPAHSDLHPDDPSELRAECLLEAEAEPSLEVRVRFLQVVRRNVRDARGNVVDTLELDRAQYLSWDEATEREVSPASIRIPAGRRSEPLPKDGGTVVREWAALEGEVDVVVEQVREGVFRAGVRIVNSTPFVSGDREEALRRSFCSTHAVLTSRNGAFVSATDPPEAVRDAVAACRNEGLWPVLVGEEGERHTMLAAPIILPDYPEVAPESPGDLFDATEIDQLLILNVLGLSDAEREEMAASDPRAREILERCASLPPEQLARLHGAIRDLTPVSPR